MSKYRPIIIVHLALLAVGALLVLTAADAKADTAPQCGVYAARAGHPHPCLVTQCPAAQGQYSECTTFVIAAHPRPSELGEATAEVPYNVTTCVIYRSGNANDCSVERVPVGGQIVVKEDGR